jgi:hypothetical protein
MIISAAGWLAISAINNDYNGNKIIIISISCIGNIVVYSIRDSAFLRYNKIREESAKL